MRSVLIVAHIYKVVIVALPKGVPKKAKVYISILKHTPFVNIVVSKINRQIRSPVFTTPKQVSSLPFLLHSNYLYAIYISLYILILIIIKYNTRYDLHAIS